MTSINGQLAAIPWKPPALRAVRCSGGSRGLCAGLVCEPVGSCFSGMCVWITGGLSVLPEAGIGSHYTLRSIKVFDWLRE